MMRKLRMAPGHIGVYRVPILLPSRKVLKMSALP